MLTKNPLNPKLFSLNCKGRLLSLEKPVVMGILNVTPDSFFDGGKYTGPEEALIQVERMIHDGASILDIGGYSSRPGAKEVSEDEELKRVVNIIEVVSKAFPDSILSIDTFRARVALEAVNAGASIVNDISAGDDDPEMISTVASLGVPYIAMHKKGTPSTMQDNPEYADVTVEILDYFIKKTEQLQQAGIKDIVIDPGFGFGKNRAHNYNLLKDLYAFKILDLPILIGISRKRMINEVLNISSKDALNGTTILNTIALLKGANILRVHDVKEAVEAIKLVNELNI